MGSLTTFLQAEFRRRSPPGWGCTSETPLLPAHLTDLLGYDPRADVVLVNQERHVRLWIEFEVSRADPVANHAKFATANLFQAQAPGDHFVALLSPHIDRGRRNLAAGAVRLMRRIGMSAFQTTLLPLAGPEEIKRLNHLPVAALSAEKIDVAAEIERIFAVITPVGRWGQTPVHFVGDLLEVLLNLRGWNDDLRTEDGKRAWGSRAVTYFVFDPNSGLFAPSKFCAYVPILLGNDRHRMTAAAYSALNDGTHVMDGQRAWKHLTSELGMRLLSGLEAGPILDRFGRWLTEHSSAVAVRGEAAFLVPPAWYSVNLS